MPVSRVLYLLHHSTLTPAEITILRSLGAKVYLPLKAYLPLHVIDDRAPYMTERADRANGKLAALLDNFNFYTDTWTADVSETINAHFDLIVTAVYRRPLVEAVTHFRGAVIIRAFGREAPASYDDLLAYYGDGLADRIAAHPDVTFGQAYPNISEVEGELLASRAVTIPVTLSRPELNRADTWAGDGGFALAFCPYINDVPFYGEWFRSTAKILDGLPHSMFGRQRQPVDHPAVQANITDEKLLSLYRSASVFIYPSTEPRHLHYAPFEAITIGTPVLYMAGSQLDCLAGEPMPGRCMSLDDMRDKCSQLVADPRSDLGRQITAAQPKLLASVSDESSRAAWAAVLKKRRRDPLR